jgi:hypothetical protein
VAISFSHHVRISGNFASNMTINDSITATRSGAQFDDVLGAVLVGDAQQRLHSVFGVMLGEHHATIAAHRSVQFNPAGKRGDDHRTDSTRPTPEYSIGTRSERSAPRISASSSRGRFLTTFEHGHPPRGGRYSRELQY